MHSSEPRRIIPIKRLSGCHGLVVTGVVFPIEISASTLAQQVGIVSWRAERNGLCRPAKEIAEVVRLKEAVSSRG